MRRGRQASRNRNGHYGGGASMPAAAGFVINDHVDILTEVLKRLDGQSLCAAACVCRLWSSIVRNDDLWEELCFRHVSPRPSLSGVSAVVAALGGYKRLYMAYIRPALTLTRRVGVGSPPVRTRRRLWSTDEVQLYLSLFCVDYYERLGAGFAGAGADSSSSSSSSSLMFLLCNPVNV